VSGNRRVGVLGGSFDPIHVGHLLMAENAFEQLGLDTVVFAPAGNPPHKPGQQFATVDDRIVMIRLAISDRPGFVCSRIDADRAGPSFSWMLLERIQDEHPGAEITFILGGDSLRDFSTWARPQRILELATIAVAARPSYDVDTTGITAVPGLKEATTIIETPMCEISSTAIRERVRRDRSIRYQVPDPVRDYSERQSLYR